MRFSREIKIGLFATICLAAMFWGINFLKGKNVLSPNHIYYTIFEQVDGLENTNDVLINGFKVGVVKKIEFEKGNTGRFIVSLLIHKKYQIPDNAVAKLISADIMGGKAIKLEYTASQVYIKPGDTLSSHIETGLIDQLGHQMVPVKEKAEKLMVEMERTLKIMSEVFNEANRDQLNQSFSNLNKSLYNVNQVTGELDTLLSPNGTLRKMFSNIESISNNIKSNNKDLTNIIKNFSTISDSIARIKVVSTFQKLDSSVSQFNNIVTKINSGEGTLGNLIKNDTLYYNLENASRNLDLLIKDVKTNPRRYVNFSIFDLSRTKYIEEKKPTKR